MRHSHNAEEQNLHEIELLNQRGGRTLSIVDLIKAGTLNVDAAAFMLCSMAGGASLLTGAGPGGVGKSTLLAATLCFLPPGERIVTVSSETVIGRALDRAPAAPECYLAHEVGAGHFYGYIWGRPVRELFELLETGRRIAATIHAESLIEARESVIGSPHYVDPARFDLVGLAAFLRREPSAEGDLRRVTYLYGHAHSVGPQLAFRWRESEDTFERITDLDAFGILSRQHALASAFLTDLVERDVHLFEEVRVRVVDFYRTEGF